MAFGNIPAQNWIARLQLLEISRVTEGTAFTDAERSSLGLVSKILALSKARPREPALSPGLLISG